MLNYRNATLKDLDKIVNIEAACFPKLEAASQESIKERINIFPDGFLLLELDNKIIGFINGAATNRETINDPMFEDMKAHHTNTGKNLAIYGVDIHPDYQGKGYSRPMMDIYIRNAKNNQRQNIILTCKAHLVNYYSSFGFESKGLSQSNHGGAEWYDMVLKLD